MGEKNKKVFRLVEKVSIRSERFGGLLFVPITGEIIQLNRVAYNLLNQMIDQKKMSVDGDDLMFWLDLQNKGLVKEVILNV